MKILSWNIQYTRGCDNQYDSDRMIKVIESFGVLDVICLQEVARNIADYDNTDQKSVFESYFVDYESVWASGFSFKRPDNLRSEFGNLTLVRRPLLLDSRIHFLPWPAHDKPKIPRVAVETTILNGTQAVTVLNTHLAFHSVAERSDQMTALSSIRDQILAHRPVADHTGLTGAYEQPPVSVAVALCGDLNIALESEEYQRVILDNGWQDCWDLQTTGNERQPTCGCHDQVAWAEGPHVRDFFLISDNPVGNISSITVDVTTDASDHQPLSMEWR